MIIPGSLQLVGSATGTICLPLACLFNCLLKFVPLCVWLPEGGGSGVSACATLRGSGLAR